MVYFWRRQWHPTPVLLPGKSHGQRSLVGCSPWGRWESDSTERLHFHFSLSCIGEGNGNPLQYSCLEDPRDGGAWWAAVYGVAQSQSRLKWLSSSMVYFLCLTYFTLYGNLQLHPCWCKWHYFILFHGWVVFHCLYVPYLLYLFTCPWIFRLLPCHTLRKPELKETHQHCL